MDISFRELMQGIAVVAVLVGGLLRVILPHISKQVKPAAPNGLNEDLKKRLAVFPTEMVREHFRKLDELYDWHNHPTTPGVMNWWTTEEDRERWKRIEEKLDK